MNNQELITDKRGRTWHIMEREDGSVVVYYTKKDNPNHWVVYDDLDNENVKQSIAEKAAEYAKVFVNGDIVDPDKEHLAAANIQAILDIG